MNSEDLIGKWDITHSASYADGSPKGTMQGKGVFDLYEGNQLLYQEQLWHTTESDDLLFATKFYHYHFEKDQISIYFYQEEDNPLFMILPKNILKGRAACKGDNYTLTWDWINEENFLTRYTAVGSQKNYIIESEFKR